MVFEVRLLLLLVVVVVVAAAVVVVVVVVVVDAVVGCIATISHFGRTRTGDIAATAPFSAASVPHESQVQKTWSCLKIWSCG